MIKKVCFLMAAIALLTFSCTTNGEDIQSFSSQNNISLNPNTASTYAAMVDLDSLLKDGGGFKVAAFDSDNNWPVNGANHFYGTDGWGFSPAIPWPSDGYPLTFYAYYPAASNLYVYPGDMSISLKDRYIMIPTSNNEQEDILFARKTANFKPASGVLSVDFKHILSKVNFTVSTVDGAGTILNPDHKAYVLAVGFNNLFYAGLFQGDLSDFNLYVGYYRAFDYLNSFEELNDPDVYQEIAFVNVAKEPFFSDDKGNLMLLPQEPDVWDVTSGVGPQPGEAYIRMLYRLDNSSYNDSIGYEFASNHPDYKDSDLKTAGYNGPLYLLVGYSFDATWVSGKAYSYDIPLPGGGGGILLDTYFYDNQGNQTDLAFDCNLYDHVFGSSCKLASAVYDWDYKAPKKSFDFVTTRTGR